MEAEKASISLQGETRPAMVGSARSGGRPGIGAGGGSPDLRPGVEAGGEGRPSPAESRCSSPSFGALWPSLVGAARPLSSPIPMPVSSSSPSQTHAETGLPQLPASLHRQVHTGFTTTVFAHTV